MEKNVFARISRYLSSSFLNAVLIAIFVFCSGCDQARQQASAEPPIVEVAIVEQRDVPIYQEWVGTLDGMVNAQILAQVTGYLIKQAYHEGAPVKKGDLLYEIDPRTFKAALDGARSDLARQQAILQTARLDLKRIERLLPEKAVSVRDRDNAVGKAAQAEAELLAARAAVQKAKLDLEFTRILSPIDGIAGLSKAQLGNLVGPGSANSVLTTVSQVDPIKAFIPLSEQQYLQLASERQQHPGNHNSAKVELILADGTIYPEPGRFYFADREVNVKTGTIQVAVLFSNPDNLLRPGQFARIRATQTQIDALLVPQRAITELQGKYMAAVIKPDNTVTMRMVTPGQRVNSSWIITSGLQAGERVVAEGTLKVREGMTVSPIPYSAPSPAQKPAG